MGRTARTEPQFLYKAALYLLYRVAEKLLDALYLTCCFWCQVTWATLYMYIQYHPVIKTLVYATRRL